jgi:hypothetical protein
MSKTESVRTKTEAIDIVLNDCFQRSGINTRVLIFSANQNLIKPFRKHLKVNKINSQLIKKYDTGLHNIMILNSRQYAFGLNLTKTTDIIFYHRMTTELTNQIVGRGQRIGRETQLRVYFLKYTDEDTD